MSVPECLKGPLVRLDYNKETLIDEEAVKYILPITSKDTATL